MTEWKLCQGSGPKPKELDATSSRYVVYERRNIHEETSGDGDMQATYWEYEERTMTQEEYAQYKSITTSAIMQSISSQAADILMGIISDQRTTQVEATIMQAINQQTADIVTTIATMNMGG